MIVTCWTFSKIQPCGLLNRVLRNLKALNMILSTEHVFVAFEIFEACSLILYETLGIVALAAQIPMYSIPASDNR